MEKMQKTQLAKMAVLLVLLLMTPFVPASLRSSYLYFLLNILIIALSAEAGLLSAISRPSDEKKAAASVVTVGPIPLESNIPSYKGINISPNSTVSYHDKSCPVVEKPAVVEKGVRPVVNKVHKLRRSPSMPSLFFIGGCEREVQFKEADQGMPAEGEMDEFGAGEVISRLELFTKAEMFIGNFYNQLKMQREESWKKIHGFYQRAF